MRRPVTLLVGLIASSLPLSAMVAPKAEASGGAVCAISGTINFTPSLSIPAQGTWSVDPAVINCQGSYRSYDVITGPGTFTGSGTYEQIPHDGQSCLHRIGSGKVDYLIPTMEADVHIVEPHEYVLAGAGAFTTPSLKGSIQVAPPYEGNCVTSPVTKATFVAEAVLLRVNGVREQ